MTPDSVELGLLFPDTGSFASTFTGFRSGVEAGVQVQNHAGGVHGRTISYHWTDDVSSLDTNLVAARELVDVDRVFAVIEGSAAEAGSAQYLADQGVPVTGLGPSTVWNQHPNMFTWSSMLGENAVTSAWGQIVRREGGTSAAVLAVVQIPSSRELATAIASSLALVHAVHPKGHCV